MPKMQCEWFVHCLQTMLLFVMFCFSNVSSSTNISSQQLDDDGRHKADRMIQQVAELTCTSELEVLKDIDLTNYVTLYDAAMDHERDKGMRNGKKEEFVTSIPAENSEPDIMSPDQLKTSEDFDTQVHTILDNVRLTRDEVLSISQLYADVEMVLSNIWPGSVAIPFGSITTGLGIKTSDADCFLYIPSVYQHQLINFTSQAERQLSQYPQLFTQIIPIPYAKVPIVKLYHTPTKTNCDISFITSLSVRNGKLLTFLLHSDPKFIPLAVIIKFWGKVHRLTGRGKMPNYALSMLLLFYLQQPPLSILPSVLRLQEDPAHDCIVDIWNTGFCDSKEVLIKQTVDTEQRALMYSVADLLGGFFEFYSNFNFDEYVVCPFLGRPIRKEVFNYMNLDNLPIEFSRYKQNIRGNCTMPMNISTPFCIQDPFKHSLNTAAGVRSELAAKIVTSFKFGADAFKKDKLNNYKKFLITILTDRTDKTTILSST